MAEVAPSLWSRFIARVRETSWAIDAVKVPRVMARAMWASSDRNLPRASSERRR